MHSTEYVGVYVLGIYGAVIPVHQPCHIQIHMAFCVCVCAQTMIQTDIYFCIKDVINRNAINTRDKVIQNKIYPKMSV